MYISSGIDGPDSVTRKTGNDLLTGKRRKLPKTAGKRRKHLKYN